MEHLGCRDLSEGGKNKQILDPWGKKVRDGQFGFESAAGGFIRILPCLGDSRVLAKVKGQLLQRTTQALRVLVVSLDLDADDSSSREQSFRDRILEADPDAKSNSPRRMTLADGTPVHLALWEARSDVAVLPAKQTLERLVCSAIHAAYPTRAPHVGDWLARRPPDSSPPELTPPMEAKAHAWSHVAGWYADRGLDEFYQRLWNDDSIAQALRGELQNSGAWSVAESIACR
ncbi:MAG: hypothetical protein HY898_19695 [Deltaproteobacteria bacterium]|nr:hypothetical protein [Deltaproteobacteria bacterium]